MAVPLVTIAMPCLNESGFIEDCLRSVLAQSYPRERIEVLVADGGSTDGTRDILARLARGDGRIRLIDNPDRIQAAGLNRILREARGDVIVRMDVHCEYAPDYVEQCVAVLERTGADNVGGSPRCRGESAFQKAVCAALRSPLGAGGAPHWDPGTEGFVNTVPFGAFRRRVFETIGGFDPRAITNEDAEINQRLVEAGMRVYLSPSIAFSYYPRATFRALARQYFRYGMGRARTALKHGRLLNLRPALPFLGLVVGLTAIAALPWTRAGLYAAGAFLAVALAEAVRVGRRDGWRTTLLAWCIFPTLLVSHGCGFAVGLGRYTVSPDWVGGGERQRGSRLDG